VKSVVDRIIRIQADIIQGKSISLSDVEHIRTKIESISSELNTIKKCVGVCVDVENPDMRKDFLEIEIHNIDKLLKNLGRVESNDLYHKGILEYNAMSKRREL